MRACNSRTGPTALVVAGTGSRGERAAHPVPHDPWSCPSETAMPTLHVHLREGFENEPVVVRVNDAIALEVADARTRPQLGLAGIHELTVPAGPIAVRVELPGRGRTHALTLDAARTPYLGVSVGPQGDPDVVSTADAFGYV